MSMGLFIKKSVATDNVTSLGHTCICLRGNWVDEPSYANRHQFSTFRPSVVPRFSWNCLNDKIQRLGSGSKGTYGV